MPTQSSCAFRRNSPAETIPRGTTPVNRFEVDVDLTDAEVIFITYAQGKETVLEKTIDEIDITPEALEVKLSQEDTLKFDHSKGVEMQIRARFPDGMAIESNIIAASAGRVLKEGVI